MALFDAMNALLDCAVAALDPPVGRAFLTTGLSVPFDDCCAGQLWVRLGSQEAVKAPKMGMHPQRPCERTWMVSVGLGAVRCAASINDHGDPPTPAALTADAQQVIVDKDVLLNQVHCCLPAVEGVKSFELVRWDAAGPDGGCVGGEWLLTMVVQTEDCADAEPP